MQQRLAQWLVVAGLFGAASWLTYREARSSRVLDDVRSRISIALNGDSMPTEVQPNYSTTITTGGLDILVAVTCSTVPEDYLPTDPKRCAKYFQKLIQDARDTFTGQ